MSDVVEENAHEFNLHSSEMDAAIDNIAENGPPEMAWQSIMSSTEENNLEAYNEDQVNFRNLQ